jgi:hypothetical protein
MKDRKCEACGCNMRRKWAGQRYGKRVLCMECNRNGWNLTKDGAKPGLAVGLRYACETWRVDELCDSNGEFWCAHDKERDIGPAIGFGTEREAVEAIERLTCAQSPEFAAPETGAMEY